MELIRIVENSDLPIQETLRYLGIARSTFYGWYERFLAGGHEALEDRKPRSRGHWNRIPPNVRKSIVELALQRTDLSPRELAWCFTDEKGYFVSESSVYRLLKAHDLITSPAYILMSASDSFKNPTRRVHEMWQTDFTYFRIVGWG